MIFQLYENGTRIGSLSYPVYESDIRNPNTLKSRIARLLQLQPADYKADFLDRGDYYELLSRHVDAEVSMNMTMPVEIHAVPERTEESQRLLKEKNTLLRQKQEADKEIVRLKSALTLLERSMADQSALVNHLQVISIEMANEITKLKEQLLAKEKELQEKLQAKERNLSKTESQAEAYKKLLEEQKRINLELQQRQRSSAEQTVARKPQAPKTKTEDI